MTRFVKAIVLDWSSYWPGMGVAAMIAMAATFLSMRYGAPAMLMALLMGLAVNFLGDSPKILPGIEWAASTVLRLGVALLGLRITVNDVVSLGWLPIIAVCSAVLMTLGFGVVMARLLGLSTRLGLLTGGAVGICGASAAMAISSVFPGDGQQRKDTLFTVIGVTTLSTMAMVIYPLISHAFALSESATGLFLGATIHDVAQVVGAGYSVSAEVGDLSTFVKLLRVFQLLPFCIIQLRHHYTFLCNHEKLVFLLSLPLLYRVCICIGCMNLPQHLSFYLFLILLTIKCEKLHNRFRYRYYR